MLRSASCRVTITVSVADGQDAGEAAATLRGAIAADQVLQKQSDRAGTTRAVERATDEFVQAVQGGVDYEQLVTLADVAKTQLALLAG